MKDSGYADFLTVKGSEITVYDANGHLLKYNCNIDFSTLPTGITDADKALWQEIMTKIVEDGGYAYLAHPFHLWYNFPGLTSGEMAALGKNGYSTWANGGWLTARDKDFYRPADGIKYYHGYTGVEIMNWMKGEEKYHSEAVLEYWDRMNILGEKKYYGIGNSDAHETDVPETEAPGTDAPDTEDSETKAPGTDAETKGGDETGNGEKEDEKPNVGLIAAGVLALAAAAFLLLKKRKAK